MGVKQWLMSQMASFDVYPINFSYGVNNGDGYKTATAGCLVIIMMLLSGGAIISAAVEAFQDMDTATVSTTQNQDDVEIIYFGRTNDTNPRRFMSMIFFTPKCLEYRTDYVWAQNRDCLIEFASNHLFFEMNYYTNEFSIFYERDPFPVGWAWTECPEGYFDEEYVAKMYSYTTGSAIAEASERALKDFDDVQKYLATTRRACRRLSC